MSKKAPARRGARAGVSDSVRGKEEEVILVDERDRELGSAGKLRAHVEGALHRAFSVFVFDERGRLLLQKRAAGKYHSAGLWSNTACGHPRPGEGTAAAARRRLREEMNFDCELREEFSFLYRAELGGGLVEHEYDHVFAGTFAGLPSPDPAEVEDWEWVAVEELRRNVGREPARYSRWLRIVVEDSGWHRLHAPDGSSGHGRHAQRQKQRGGTL
ncbi:MAG TPA: isopentenyl-diphosphate Delta-isomerase [Pyrinomonadaceae bacterium]|nr:isopentenyl-diphosphate Delta-isomerase [Pyrinomonadaceae bacterium]